MRLKRKTTAEIRQEKLAQIYHKLGIKKLQDTIGHRAPAEILTPNFAFNK